MGSLEICWRKYYTSPLSYFNGGVPSIKDKKRSCTNVMKRFYSPKESWEDEIKKIQEDTTKDDRIVRVTHIIDVENFWAQIGKLKWTVKLYSAVT